MKTTLKLSVITASVLATTLLLSSTAFAGHGYKGEANYKGEAAPCPPPERGLQSGFYLGAQGGYDSYRIRNNVSLGTPGGASFSANPAINATGFVGGLFAGYGAYFSDFYYLAGEVLGNYSGASSNVTINTADALGTSTFSANNNVYGSWGLSVLPGLKLNNDSLLYVRLGYNWARIKNSASFATTVPAAAPLAGSSSTSNWSGGFNYGLGIETLIYQNWSMRTEYSHTNNNSYNANFSGGRVNFNPANNQFMVGILYHFA